MMGAGPVKRLNELCDVTSSKRIYANELSQSGVPFYRTKDIVELLRGETPSGPLFIPEERFIEILKLTGAPVLGDVLLTSRGTLGIPYFVKESDRFHFADGNLTWFRNFRELDSRYLFYFFLSPAGKAELSKCVIGVAQAAYTIASLKNIEISVPALPIQQRIAGILSAYDELIENSKRRIKILEAMACALYREWFVHFRFPGHENHPRVASPLGEIPDGWEVKRVIDAVQFDPSVVVPRDGEKPFVPMGCLSNDSMLITDIESRCGNSGAKFQNGDTLFARITPCLENGKTSYVQFLPDEKSVAFGSTEFIVLRSVSLTPEFVYCLARSNEFRDVAIKSMSGASGRQRVQKKCFNDIQFAQPPQALLEKFSAIVAPSFRLIYSLHQQIQNLHRTRDLLLPRLLSGQTSLLEEP